MAVMVVLTVMWMLQLMPLVMPCLTMLQRVRRLLLLLLCLWSALLLSMGIIISHTNTCTGGCGAPADPDEAAGQGRNQDAWGRAPKLARRRAAPKLAIQTVRQPARRRGDTPKWHDGGHTQS